jgi:hypothetical protein
MWPSFFTKETGGCIVPGLHYTNSGQAQKPYKAMASLLPLRTLVSVTMIYPLVVRPDATPITTLFKPK